MNPATFRSQRERLGLSQVELAALLGIANTTVSRYELGKIEIPPPTALAMRLLSRTAIREYLESES